jgi:hypothetical protein
VFDCSEKVVASWLLNGREIRKAHFIEWPRDDLERAVRKFREAFERCDLLLFDIDVPHLFVDTLLAPLMRDVAPGRPLIIVPDGILALLPFKPLVVGGDAHWKEGRSGEYYPDGLIYLAYQYPVSYYQSITALSLVRNQKATHAPGSGLLVIADPVFDQRDDWLRGVDARAASPAERGSGNGGWAQFVRVSIVSNLTDWSRQVSWQSAQGNIWL